MSANHPDDSAGGSSEQSKDVAAVDADLLARHAELVAIDHVIGLEAMVARLTYDLRRSRERAKRLKAQLDARDAEIVAMRASRTWRLGRLLTRPFSRAGR